MTATELAAELATEPFFEGMSRDALTRIASAARPIAFPSGHRVFAEGGVADRFWLLQDGTVALDLHAPEGGPAVVVDTLGAGAVLGWSWWHAPYRWRSGAVALSPVRAVEFDARLVRALCAIDPVLGYEMSRRFTKVVADRLQATRLRLLHGDAHAADRP
jgi:CRP/FNR family cyclic AMP-dependent transcriptional regulator